MDSATKAIEISIIVPVYNGSRYLEMLVEKTRELQMRWKQAKSSLIIVEVIFVLDEPIDDSHQVLQKLRPQYPWMRIINLSRNYGQHSATIAGILYSCGEWVVTLDEDLQHKPKDIENLLKAAASQNINVIYAEAADKVHGGLYRDLVSKLAKSFISLLSGNKHIPQFNSFRLIRGDLARAAAAICAQTTYFDVALTWFTQRINTTAVALVDDRHRQENLSGYNLMSLIKHAKRLILSSGFTTLRFTTSISIFAIACSIIYGIFILFSTLSTGTIEGIAGWPSLMIVILSLGGLSVFILGFILELAHTGTLQLLGKPTFFIVDRSSDDNLSAELAKLPN